MNPFTILGVTRQATHKEVIQAVGQAMRARQYSAQTIARAQKLLLDPESWACQSFLHFVDLQDAKNGLMREMAEICEQIEQQHDPGNMPLQCLSEIELEDDL
jgi:phosphoribosylformimino-5-aminoimidazole carboxamide ribonucleotide (ProFAR) isomerase